MNFPVSRYKNRGLKVNLMNLSRMLVKGYKLKSSNMMLSDVLLMSIIRSYNLLSVVTLLAGGL